MIGRLILLALALSATALPLLAVDYAWTGRGDGTTWNVAANWSPSSGYPQAGDVAYMTNGVGETAIVLTQETSVSRIWFDQGRWRFKGAKLTFESDNPFPWNENGPKPRDKAIFENEVCFSNTGVKKIYGGKVYKGAVSAEGSGRVFFARQYNHGMDDSGSVVRQVVFSGRSCVADFTTLDNFCAGSNNDNVRDGVEMAFNDGVRLSAKRFLNFPGTATTLTNATVSTTGSGDSLDVLYASSFGVFKGATLSVAGRALLGQGRTDAALAPSLLLLDRGVMTAGSIVQDFPNHVTRLRNGGSLTVSGNYELTAGTLEVEDARAIVNGQLKMASGARLVVDPVAASLFSKTAPVFASGAKIALSSAYASYTKGRFLLLSWQDGTFDASSLDGLFDASSASGASPALSVEEEDGRSYLWLDLDSSAVYPTVRVMPVGDSITEGKVPVGNYGNWRMTCMKALSAAGYAPVSAGWRDIYPEDHAGAAMPKRWRFHAGISGQRIFTNGRAGHLEAIGAELDQAGDPDVVLMMIGTNDLDNDVPAATAAAAWSNLVAKIVRARPTTRIVCGTVVGRTDGSAAERQAIVDFNLAMTNMIAAGAFPPNQVFVSENNAVAPTEMFFNGLHPNWFGMIRIGREYARAALAALAAPAVAAEPRRPMVARGWANNVPAAYREGFKLACVVRPSATTRYAMDTDPYETVVGALAATQRIARVGYYVELRRKNTDFIDYGGHVRWIWIDMDAFGDRDIASVGFPTTDATVQRRVTRLHVASNEPLIEAIPPSDETREGWIQFSPHNLSSDGSGIAGAPSDFFGFDWNDAFGTGIYGAMQIYALTPGRSPTATTLFAYNRWARDSSDAREILIGDFAQHVTSPVSISGVYTFPFPTMNASAYDDIVIEIYTQGESGGLAVVVK